MSRSHRWIQLCFMTAGLLVGFSACVLQSGNCPTPRSMATGTFDRLQLTTRGEHSASFAGITLEQLEIREDTAVLSYWSGDGSGSVTFTFQQQYPPR